METLYVTNENKYHSLNPRGNAIYTDATVVGYTINDKNAEESLLYPSIDRNEERKKIENKSLQRHRPRNYREKKEVAIRA